MTTTPKSTATTIQIRQGGRTVLGMSYDYTDLGTLMPMQKNFQLWIDQAIERWWSSLSPSQRSALPGLKLNLRISDQFLPSRE